MPRLRPSARRSFTFALGLAAWLASGGPGAQGSTRSSAVDYATTGSIGTDGVAGPNLVRFVGTDDAVATTATPFEVGQIPAVVPGDRGASLMLGRFEVEAPSLGTSTIYDHTPFAIRFDVRTIDGGPPAPGQEGFVVRGWLDGSVGGTGPSALMAHYQLAGSFGLPFEPRDDVGSFEAGIVRQTLTIPGFATALALPIGGAGSTTVTGVLVGDAALPSPAPEPGPLLAFLAAGVALAIHARGRARAHRV